MDKFWGISVDTQMETTDIKIKIHFLPSPQRPEEKLPSSCIEQDLGLWKNFLKRELLNLKEGIKGNCEDASFFCKYSWNRINSHLLWTELCAPQNS